LANIFQRAALSNIGCPVVDAGLQARQNALQLFAHRPSDFGQRGIADALHYRRRIDRGYLNATIRVCCTTTLQGNITPKLSSADKA